MDSNKNNSLSPIDLDKLRQSQIKREQFFKSHPDLLEETLIKEREKRQAAKESIITKVTTVDENPVIESPQEERQFDTKVLKHARSKITIIKNDNPEVAQIQKFKQTQDKLSYTLQMDVLSKAKIIALRERRTTGKFSFEDKFKKYDKVILRYYLSLSALLLILLISTIFIYISI